MNLKKYLKIKKAQAALEYILLFAANCSYQLNFSEFFFPSVREAIQGQDGYFKKAVDRIVNADQG